MKILVARATRQAGRRIARLAYAGYYEVAGADAAHIIADIDDFSQRFVSQDVVIGAFGRTSEPGTLQTYYDGFPGWGWRGWAGMGTSTTEVVPEKVGNLTIDIFDGQTKQLIWRGQAAQAITGNNPEKNEHKLDDAVDKMFKEFPPKSKG